MHVFDKQVIVEKYMIGKKHLPNGNKVGILSKAYLYIFSIISVYWEIKMLFSY